MLPDEKLEMKVVSSLAKVFPDEEIKDPDLKGASMLLNETYSFQVAYKWDGAVKKNVAVKVESDLYPYIKIYQVGLVPVEMPCYVDHDENILRSVPGLYPDILQPVEAGGIVLLPEQWRSLWIEISPDGVVEAETHPISISFVSEDNTILETAQFELDIINASLPEQTLIYTNWFHTDCLATWYQVGVFSEEHWRIIEQYVKCAASHGMNMILTPIVTPPLDTQVGGERPTVQLVDISMSGEQYVFDYSKLKRWITLCFANGIKYFEISHLFTQWGAKHASKIMCHTETGDVRIFGWETDALGETYRNFLSQLLTGLASFIKSEGLENRCFFHISDEPSMEHLAAYENASSIIYQYLEGFPVMDALSDYEFYEKGLVKKPIPSTDHISHFLEHQVQGLWAYYCCGQHKKVANRFINMPSARNRILGFQLYKYNIEGFLHWGYNFWYSQYSLRQVDPFRVTDADYAFPSGDAFVVYPGEAGPLVSLRLKVFYETLQDMRALQLLEIKIGREEVIQLLDDGLETPITFDDYPTDARWIINKREQINRMI